MITRLTSASRPGSGWSRLLRTTMSKSPPRPLMSRSPLGPRSDRSRARSSLNEAMIASITAFSALGARPQRPSQPRERADRRCGVRSAEAPGVEDGAVEVEEQDLGAVVGGERRSRSQDPELHTVGTAGPTADDDRVPSPIADDMVQADGPRSDAAARSPGMPNDTFCDDPITLRPRGSSSSTWAGEPEAAATTMSPGSRSTRNTSTSPRPPDPPIAEIDLVAAGATPALPRGRGRTDRRGCCSSP